MTRARFARDVAAGLAFAAWALAASLAMPRTARAQVESGVQIPLIEHVSTVASPRDRAPQSLAFEVAQRTSIEARGTVVRARLDDASLFASPLVLWRGDRAFGGLSDVEIRNLRRFVDAGGLLVVDDASPNADFDLSFRRAVARAFPAEPLHELAENHTLSHSFYLLTERMASRGVTRLEGVERNGRVAVLYVRGDLSAALARTADADWSFNVAGGDTARELAVRLAVNIVMYALCLDYKDDQVHAPFLIRRRTGALP